MTLSRHALADVIACLTGDGDMRLADFWRVSLRAYDPLARISRRVEVDARGVATFNVVERVGTIPNVALRRWRHATPAEAFEALTAAELLPAHWLDPERAPRWWCERCKGTRLVRSHNFENEWCGSCDRDEDDQPTGHTASPPSHPALVAVVSLDVDALGRAESIVAETWGARIVWRVMTAEEIADHHDRVSGEVPPLGGSVLPLVFSVETLTATNPRFQRNSRKSWEERCPYGGDWWRGGFGTPDDDHHGVHRAWPALRALARTEDGNPTGMHLVAIDDDCVTLAVEAVA